MIDSGWNQSLLLFIVAILLFESGKEFGGSDALESQALKEYHLRKWMHHWLLFKIILNHIRFVYSVRPTTFYVMQLALHSFPLSTSLLFVFYFSNIC